MSQLVRCCLLLMCTGIALRLPAQAGQDSVQVYVALLEQLVQGDNFEQAQVEAQHFRAYLQRQAAAYPAAAIPLLSSIFRHNKDEDSALEFLTEAGQTAGRAPDPATRAGILQALIRACTDWKQTELAFATQQQLAVAQDSLAERGRQAAIRDLRLQMDSLATLRNLEKAEQNRFVRIERNLALWAALGVFLAFFGLLLFHRRAIARWRKRLAKRELENDFLRSERFTSTLPVEAPVAELEANAPAPERSFMAAADDKRPDKTALLIEPNRQIVLYLKSLLSDRFELETAGSASEGLLMASNHMPDLIVCDAVLNGKTGIEVIRQIKLSERTNHIPVILLSERYGNEGKLDALRAGADAWFSRPVLDDEFDSEVSRLLDARKQKHDSFARFLHLFYSENRIALDDPFLTRTVELIDLHLADPDFMAEELARKMQLHKQHYFKKLQTLTGKAPLQLIREMRLEKAKVLLEKRAGTPQAIAELVGFASSGSFALAFKEYFGENTSLLQGGKN